jgi:hypothetical protein
MGGRADPIEELCVSLSPHVDKKLLRRTLRLIIRVEGWRTSKPPQRWNPLVP